MGYNENTSPLVSDPDADLIAGLRAGDEGDLARLMDRHMNVIYKLSFYMLSDAMAAEDVTQIVFLKTWAQMPDWQPGKAKLLTWMRRVATHSCLDYLKKKKPIYTDMVPEVLDATDTPFEALARQQQSARVQSAMATLSGRQRAALTLSYYQGVSQKDGSAILGISESAYESLLVRARKTMKLKLNSDMAAKIDPKLL